jgi:hypothetical protein
VRRIPVIALALAIVLALAPSAGRQAADGRIVAIGDVHGACQPFAGMLTKAGLLDQQGGWAGGKTVFVQTGDLTDRGDGVRAALDLVMALEQQAATAGGRVQTLLGNHEVMNLLGETRDVSAAAYSSFADDESEARRQRAFSAARRLRGTTLTEADRDAWMAAHPPGFIEYREAFAPRGRYGRWFRSKPLVATIAGTTFMHAGISPDWPASSIDDVNRRARDEISRWDDAVRWMEQQDLILPSFTLKEVIAAATAEVERLSDRRRPPAEADARAAGMLQAVLSIGESSLLAPAGPLWFRGYSLWTDEEGAPQMQALVRKFKTNRFVTGHTVQERGQIRERFGGRLFLIDTGMLNGRFFPGGRPSALELVGDKAIALYFAP